jgi:hypothetical protein
VAAPAYRAHEAIVIGILSGSDIGPDKFELLCRVLHESFAKVIAARPIFDPGAEMDIRGRLAEQIREAFDRGVVDPEILKQIAVRTLTPKPDDIG